MTVLLSRLKTVSLVVMMPGATEAEEADAVAFGWCVKNVWMQAVEVEVDAVVVAIAVVVMIGKTRTLRQH